MYLLDADVIAELRPGCGDASTHVLAWAAGVALELQFVSALTLYKLEHAVVRAEKQGAGQGGPLRAWLDSVRETFADRVLAVDARTAARGGQIVQRMAEMDRLIAATAIMHRLTLVTRDVVTFEGTGAKLLNPWDTSAEP